MVNRPAILVSQLLIIRVDVGVFDAAAAFVSAPMTAWSSWRPWHPRMGRFLDRLRDDQLLQRRRHRVAGLDLFERNAAVDGLPDKPIMIGNAARE
jgi:hypothetical protein